CEGELQFIHARKSQGNLGTRHHKRRRPCSFDAADPVTAGHCAISSAPESEQCLSRISIGSIAYPGAAAASPVDRNTAVSGTRTRRHLVRFAAGQSDKTVLARTDRTSSIHLAEGTGAGHRHGHVLPGAGE